MSWIKILQAIVCFVSRIEVRTRVRTGLFPRKFGRTVRSDAIYPRKLPLELATASASGPVWLGLKQDPDTFAWSWPDGLEGWAGYSHWAVGNPINREPPATCVNLYPTVDGDSTGLWKNEYCNCADCKVGAICVETADGTTPTKTTTTRPPGETMAFFLRSFF